MKKKITFYFFAVIALCTLSACEQGRNYTYIEVIEVEEKKGHRVKKFKTGKRFKAGTDSAAYVKSFVDFCMSIEVYRRSAASAKWYHRPIDFIIQNENGEDISKYISFHEKKSFEKRVQKDLRKLVIPTR